MVAVPWPVSSAPGKRPHESAGRLINALAEPLVNGARGQYGWRRAPGLRQFATTAHSGDRGRIVVGNDLYSAFSGTVSRFTSAGVETSVGTLAGTKKVFWACNNKSPTPDIVVVDPDNGASVVTSGSVADYPDPDLPAVNSVCFLDSYFFFTTGDGRCFASGQNDTTINALDEVGAEGKRDGLLRAVAFNDLYLAGQKSIEVWRDTAEQTGFPFSRSTVIPKGLLSPYAMTGHEDGFAKGLIWLGDDGCVYALNGYAPTKISTPDVDRSVAAFKEAGGDVTTIEMFPFVAGGHSCVALTCSAFTWVFDIDNIHWHERASYGLNYWRATGAVSAFNKWICGDASSGKLADITDTVGNELGNPLAFIMESGPVSAFPNNVAVSMATFAMARGVGIATGSDNQADPSAEISWSDDGGVSWKNPRIRKLGPQSVVSRNPIRVSKTGRTTNEGRRWRVVVTDDVDVIFTGADMLAEPRQG